MCHDYLHVCDFQLILLSVLNPNKPGFMGFEWYPFVI